MEIRNARRADVPALTALLSQVLELHAALRPDIFKSGTTKYTEDELFRILDDADRPVFVAEEDGKVVGYAFCVLRRPAFSTTMHDVRTLYIDDLCVDERFRARHVGKALFEHAAKYGAECGCAAVTLAVWEGNDSARAFYDAMGMTVRETILEKKL